MIIQSSDISMVSKRNYVRNTNGQRITTKWQAGKPASAATTIDIFSYCVKEDSVYNNYSDFSKNVRQNSKQNNNTNTQTPALTKATQKKEPLMYFREAMNKTLRGLLELLYKARELPEKAVVNNNTISDTAITQAQQPIIWHQVTDTFYSVSEEETTSFASFGKAITADGREIQFDVSFTMSRSFKEEYLTSEFTQYEQVLTDPLVINLDSNPDYLSEQTFFFDIDCDGKEDEISSLASGTGFLAYDKNNDGIINDGSELFGTKSGNGFYDLMAYDDDNNGWIDEADSIFKDLKVWTRDEDGNNKLVNLKEADVGAIYLRNSNTQFSLTDSNNTLKGMVRSTGIFLKESGGSGTISQIDLAKHQEV